MGRITRFRTIIFVCLVALLMGGYVLRLYKLQAVEPENGLVTADADSMQYMTTVEAARGNILDRNGNILVSNRASYNLVIINFVLFNAKQPNERLLQLLELCDDLGIRYASHFPVTAEIPYSYNMDALDSSQQKYFRSFLDNRDYDLDISAQTLMKKLRAGYRIPSDWTQEQAYKVISVRYELELRSIPGIGLENYTLASDVSAENLAAVMELGIPGVIVETGTVREFHTTSAAHLLGTIGQIYAEEADAYREKGYALNALVGKSGVEQETLDVCTAVSRETAHEMARGARERLMTDCAVSVTGLAGPDGDGTGRPVGLVYIAVDTAGFSFCKELHLSGSRAEIREQAAEAVFQLILDTI